MKLLIATTSHLSAVLIKGQGAYFKKNNFEVIFCSSDGIQARNLVKQEKLVFEPIPFAREIDIFRDLYCLWLCCVIIRRHKPDIVNAGTPKAGLLMMIAARLMRVKVRIFTLRGIRSSSLQGIKKKVVRVLEKISCNAAQKVIAISPSLKEEAVNLNLVNKNKITVLSKGSSNGIDLSRFRITKTLENRALEIRNRLNISQNSFIYGYIGRIVKDKGIHELIDAFLMLSKKYDCVLVLVGEFENDDTIGADYKDKIKFSTSIIEIGYSDEIPTFAYLFDVLILNSYREGFGNVVIEAAAMKTPSIVSNISGARDTIIDKETGLLVAAGSVESLYDAMNWYIEHKEVAAQHGREGFRRVREHFQNNTIWEEQKKLYLKLVQEAEV